MCVPCVPRETLRINAPWMVITLRGTEGFRLRGCCIIAVYQEHLYAAVFTQVRFLSAAVLKLLKMAVGMRSLLDTVMQALPQVNTRGSNAEPHCDLTFPSNANHHDTIARKHD